MINNEIGTLLTNVGTPAAPTPQAVRRYLKAFLSGARVIEAPRWLWWPILYGAILPFRPRHSAKLYQKIWTTQGPPLLIYSTLIAEKLQQQLKQPVAVGMHYGRPSIEEAVKKLLTAGVKKIVILPLFPQYSATTSAVSFDQTAAALKKIRHLPEIIWRSHYADNANYINAIAQQITQTAQTHGQPQHLLFSFHGIPQRYADAGDCYPQLCYRSVQLIVEKLNLPQRSWSIAFQSRLGRLKWSMPYTDVVLKSLPQQGVTNLHVICPGFAVDCLETLEEIAIRGKAQFMAAGGKSFHYISALNDSHEQIDLLTKLIRW